MQNIYLGIVFSGCTISVFEIFRISDKKLVAALLLTGIAYIYLGFNWFHLLPLTAVAISVVVFTMLSYIAYKKDDIRLISLGLLLHAVWDVICPHIGVHAPTGYDWFCIVFDIVLAFYFFYRLK